MAGHGNKKIFLCPGEGDRTGVHLFLAPGSPPPWCLCAPVLRVLPCCWSATRLVTRASTIAAPHQKHGATAKSLRGLQNCCIKDSTAADHVKSLRARSPPLLLCWS